MTDRPAFEIDLSRSVKGVSCVTARGEIDLAAERAFEEVIRSALQAASADALVLDLRAVTFMDSSGLRCVLVAQREAKAAGLGFRLRIADGAVERLLKAAGVWDWLQYE